LQWSKQRRSLLDKKNTGAREFDAWNTPNANGTFSYKNLLSCLGENGPQLSKCL